ncbi:MAG: sodium:dicarboxylate symporter [Oscillospiraceae bacterium]|jgi:Na+/H+-dicarboxylate symporter|nr:sodium:dicarboxylate symporter [Oscillospiraceae bacterium]
MRSYKNIPLWAKILAAIIIGAAVGIVSPAAAEAISPLGDVFLRLLKMLIVPLVFFTLVSGVCKTGDIKQLRSVGGRTVLYFVVTSTVAAAVGTVLALITQPGKGTTDFLQGVAAAEAQSYSFIDNIVTWVPTNIVEAMASANMLQIIFFSIILGIALLTLGEKVSSLITIIDQCAEGMLKVTDFVMAFSPYGILALIAGMVSTLSGAMMKEVFVFIATDIVACVAFIFICYPLMLKFMAKVSPIKFVRNIAPAMLVAASTSSSAATLPVSIKCAEEKLGVPEYIYGFCLPLGNTCNMNGMAIAIGCISVFASNLYGLKITPALLFQFVFLGLILSIGAAGVKGAGVVMSTVLLQTLGLPLTLIPILAAIWPVIDPGHTTANNVGDLACTTVVAARLNKLDREKFNGKINLEQH